MKKIGKVAIMGMVVLIVVVLIVGIILFSSENHPAYLLNGTIVLPDQILEAFKGVVVSQVVAARTDIIDDS